MNEQKLTHLVEAVLLAAGRPVTSAQLLDLFETHERPAPEQLQAALEALAAEYEARGIELQQVASGWRIQVRSRYVDLVSRLWQERPAKYSRALLETLALIAYRQPITRAEIEAVRGVAVSSTIMRTLHDRNWIRVVGHREVPGRPEVLGTTRDFLDYFGLKKLEDLPSLAALNEFETVGVQLELPSSSPTDEAAAASAETSASAEAAAPESEVTPEVPAMPADARGSDDAEAVSEERTESPVAAAETSEAASLAGEVVITDLVEVEADGADGADHGEGEGDLPEPRNAAANEEEDEVSLLAAPEEDDERDHDIEEPPVGV